MLILIDKDLIIHTIKIKQPFLTHHLIKLYNISQMKLLNKLRLIILITLLNFFAFCCKYQYFNTNYGSIKLYKNKIFYFKQIKIYQILTKVLRLIINFDLIDKKVKKNSYLFLIFSLNFCFKKPFFFLFFFRNLNDLLLI